eukprot:1014747_1
MTQVCQVNSKLSSCQHIKRIAAYLHLYEMTIDTDPGIFNQDTYPCIVSDFVHILIDHFSHQSFQEMGNTLINLHGYVNKFVKDCTNKRCKKIFHQPTNHHYQNINQFFLQTMDLMHKLFVHSFDATLKISPSDFRNVIAFASGQNQKYRRLNNECAKIVNNLSMLTQNATPPAIDAFMLEKLDLIVSGYIQSCWNEYDMQIWFPSQDVVLMIVSYMPTPDIFSHVDTNLEVNNKLIQCHGFEEYCQCLKRKENQSSKWYHAFGSLKVENGTCKTWKFKVLSSHNCGSVIIGIVDAKKMTYEHGRGDFTEDPCNGYGLCTDNGVVYHGSEQLKRTKICGRVNDIITMELDMMNDGSDGILKFCVDNDNDGDVQNDYQTLVAMGFTAGDCRLAVNMFKQLDDMIEYLTDPEAKEVTNEHLQVAFDDIDLSAAWVLSVAVHDDTEIALLSHV